MNKNFLIIVFILGLNTLAQAGNGHNHDEEKTPVKQIKNNEESHDHKDGDHNHEKEHANHDHGKEEKKEDHKDHDGEEKEGEKNIGPNKGVTSFDEEKGFTLSEEAKKKFSIETELVTGEGPWKLPDSALLLTGNEKNIYRYRNGAFKRIDIVIVEKTGDQVFLTSLELKSGDSVVVKGVGFIRTAEVDASSGEGGHHH